MKTLKLYMEDALVSSNWRRWVNEQHSGVNVSDCFWYRLTRLIRGLKRRKIVVAVVVIIKHNHLTAIFLVFLS